MSTNTELIADLQSNIVGDPFPLMRKAADAIEALEAELKNVKAVATNNSFSMLIAQRERDALQAEVDRLTTLAHGQHIELYNARLQLAAAQGQEPVAWQCKEIGGSFWQECAKERGLVRAARPEKWEVRPLYAAPIPQQPAPSVLIGEMRDNGVVWFNQNPHAWPLGTTYYAVAAPQPKETK